LIVNKQSILDWLELDTQGNWFGLVQDFYGTDYVICSGLEKGFSKNPKIIAIFQELVDSGVVKTMRFNHLGNKSMYFSINR